MEKIKTLSDAINWAKEGGVALGHFNISDSTQLNGIAKAAWDARVPVIVGVSEGERDFLGLNEAISLVKTARNSGFPIFINADHTYSLEKAKIAVDRGVDAVIIDSADQSFEENIKRAKNLVEYTRRKNPDILVEAELGFIGKSSNVLETLPDGVSVETQTDPTEAAEFVKQTNIDLLAPSVGNIHGMVKTGNPKLNIERIRLVKKATGIPLVLHGGSGISDDEFLRAIDAGISIIHINTELRIAYKAGIEEGLKSNEIAPYKFLAKGVEEMKKVVKNRLKLFNKL